MERIRSKDAPDRYREALPAKQNPTPVVPTSSMLGDSMASQEFVVSEPRRPGGKILGSQSHLMSGNKYRRGRKVNIAPSVQGRQMTPRAENGGTNNEAIKAVNPMAQTMRVDAPPPPPKKPLYIPKIKEPEPINPADYKPAPQSARAIIAKIPGASLAKNANLFETQKLKSTPRGAQLAKGMTAGSNIFESVNGNASTASAKIKTRKDFTKSIFSLSTVGNSTTDQLLDIKDSKEILNPNAPQDRRDNVVRVLEKQGKGEVDVFQAAQRGQKALMSARGEHAKATQSQLQISAGKSKTSSSLEEEANKAQGILKDQASLGAEAASQQDGARKSVTISTNNSGSSSEDKAKGSKPLGRANAAPAPPDEETLKFIAEKPYLQKDPNYAIERIRAGLTTPTQNSIYPRTHNEDVGWLQAIAMQRPEFIKQVAELGGEKYEFYEVVIDFVSISFYSL